MDEKSKEFEKKVKELERQLGVLRPPSIHPCLNYYTTLKKGDKKIVEK